MKMSQMLRLVLALCLLVGMLAVPALATEIETSGTCGENVTWEYQDGVLTISGTGAMKDYSLLISGPWYDLRESITSVVIGDGVTYIGEYAFAHSPQLQQVTLGRGVASIGAKAFGYCDALQGVAIPSNVREIGAYAFGYCDGLASLTMEYGVVSIGPSAFIGCIALEEVELPDSVILLGSNAFERCEKLSRIKLSENLTVLDDHTFKNCTALTRVELPDSITVLREGVFQYCENLSAVPMSGNLTEIGEAAFYGCKALDYIYLPEGLKTIGDWAFCDCLVLDGVSIPKSMESIGRYAFISCESLKNLTINEGVTHIGTAAFKDCTALEKVKIPNSVTELGNAAFKGCTALTAVTLSENLTEICDDTFYNCHALKRIAFPDKVATIGETAFFHCRNLASISFGMGVQSIGYQAFTDAGNDLETPCWLLFSGDAPEIDEKAFIDVRGLGQYYGLNPTWTEDKMLDYGGEITWMPSYSAAYIATLSSGELQETYIHITPVDSREGVSSGKTLNDVTISSAEGVRELGFDQRISINSAAVQDVVLSKDGYRDYVIPARVAAGMRGHDGKAYDLTAIMTKFPRFGKNKPYISTVFGRNTGAGESYVELRSTQLVVSSALSQEVVVTVRGFEGQDVSYYIGTRGPDGSLEDQYILSRNGVFTGMSLAGLLNGKNTVYVWARSNDTGKETEPVALCLTKSASSTDLEEKLKKGEISLLGDDGLKVKLGGNDDLFGGMEFDVADFEMPVGFYLSGNTMKVSLGFDLFESGDTKEKAASKWDALKKLVYEKGKRSEKAEKAVDAYSQWLKDLETFGKNNGLGKIPEQTREITDLDFKVGAMGYAELKYVDGQWVVTDGALCLDGEFSLAHNVQTYIAWVPVYGAVKGGAEFQLAGGAKQGVPGQNTPFSFYITLGITPKISIHGGAGVANAASGGLYGAGSLPIDMEFSNGHLTIKAKGEIGAEAEFFGTTSKKVLLESDEITLLDKFFGVDSQAVTMNMGGGRIVTTVMSRDYAEDTSQWLRSPAQKQNASTHSTQSVAARGVAFQNLQTSIFSNSQPQLVTVGDQMVLVWSEDDSQRNSYNRMRLVYSIYDPAGDAWSEPAPVWDDGRNDGYARMVSDGQNVWLLWQKVNALLTEQTAVDLAFVQANTELCLARFDSANGIFRDQQMITSNDVYEYAHSICLNNGVPSVFWASAGENALNGSGIHSITAWCGGNVEILAQSLNYVLSIAAADGEVTYVADGDGDLSTTADITAFTITAEGTTVYDNSATGRAVTNAVYASVDGVQTLFVSDLTNVYYRKDGQWNAVFGEARSVGADLQIVETPLGTTLLWTEAEQGWNELYTARFANGTWSDAVKISDNGQILSKISAVCYDGKLTGVCNANTVTLNSDTGEYTTEATDLRFFQANEFTDLVLNASLPMDEADLERGQDATVYVTVYNQGTTAVENITFTLTDTLGTEVAQTLSVQLGSGESQVVTLTYPVPDAYAAATLTISACAGADADPSDNVISMEIGKQDLSIAESSVEILEDGYLIKAIVENDSLVDAENVTLEVRTGDEGAETHWVEFIGTIGRENYVLVGIVIPEEKLAFDENGMAKVVLTLAADGEEAAEHDNSICIPVEKAVRPVEEVVTEVATGWSGATQWTLTSDGILTVYGTGNMKNYGWEGNQPWAAYADQITAVVIEEGVAQIGSGAFKDLTKLENVQLPTSLTKIGIAAFYGCTSLEEIYIPDGIYTIWEYTFKNCTALESVRLPKTLIKIDQGAFEACTSLTYLFLPTNTEIIGGWSFKGCISLTEVDMQWADATEIRAGAFKNCTSLTKIILPGNIRTLGDSCFYGIGATSFVVPETVTKIADWCFARSSIQEITFEGDAPTIGTGAFNKIALTAYYNSDNATWTSDIMQNYGGTVTWKAN